MILFEIIFALWWVWIPALIIWLVVRSSKNNNPDQKYSPSEKDVQWHNYILSFKNVAKTKAEQDLLDAILERRTSDQLYAKPSMAQSQVEAPTVSVTEPAFQPAAASQDAVQKQPSTPIDNTLLLLYFGAFLLIAAAGLFVAIGDFSGGIRTAVIAITAALLYIGGLWLYRKRKKLEQAGLSFMGVGMAVLPLVGVAWYNLISEQTNGAMIWMLTSAVCLAVYAHAYLNVKNSFMSYLLIGSFVSTIESSVLLFSLPSYGYVWGALIAGLLLQAVDIKNAGNRQVLRSASNVSSQLIVPLSVTASLFLLPNFGSIQLGVALLLASAYYGLLSYQRPDKAAEYLLASQASVLSALSSFAYAIDGRTEDIAAFLGTATLVYVLLITKLSFEKTEKFYLVYLASLSIGISILLSLADPWPLTVYSAIGLLLATVVWLKTKSQEALAVGLLIFLALPFLIGQYAVSPRLGGLDQLYLVFIAVIAIGLLLYGCVRFKSLNSYYPTLSMFYIIAATVALATAWTASFNAVLLSTLILCASFGLFRYLARNSEWIGVLSILIAAPVLYAYLNGGIGEKQFALAVGVSLAVSIVSSLLSREQAARWMLALMILITPLALGGGALGWEWKENGFTGGYLLAMAGCILARAIARGKLLVSSKVSISSYEKYASVPFVAGYILAAFIALSASLAADNSRLLTTIVLALLIATSAILAYIVETNRNILLAVPVLFQGMLLSGLRPDLNEPYQIALTAVALAFSGALLYIISTYNIAKNEVRKNLLLVSAASSYAGPLMVLTGSDIHPLLPLSLSIAGLLTAYHNRKSSKDVLEASVWVVIVSIIWILYLSGVKNIHIHTHLLAVFLAGLAYWRYTLKDHSSTQNHILLFYAVPTVPLIIQALAGTAGEQYGLLLIIQQAVFMTFGALINQRILLKAGLWVAVGAVLYQLRGLGWAFVGIIAVVLIAIAIYRLQKHEDNTSPSSKS